MPDPNPPAQPRPLRDWYEKRSPAVRALIVIAATTAINLFAPWAAPFLRPSATADTPAQVAPK